MSSSSPSSTPKTIYNELERQTLVNLVMQHQAIIDSKRVDADTLTRKRQTWLKITNEYNRQPRVRKRVTKQLRRLWENTKARAKKGRTVPHELLNESIDEPAMETIHTENNPNAASTSGRDSFYGDSRPSRRSRSERGAVLANGDDETALQESSVDSILAPGEKATSCSQ